MSLALASALLFATLTADSPAANLRDAPVDQLIERGRAALAALGAYRVQTTSEERIGGKMQQPRTIQLWVREEPFAARAEFIAGPGKGRRVLYDATAHPDSVRVRDTGILGFAAFSLGIHSSLVTGDTNHPVTDLGLGAILRVQAADVERAKAFGGYHRTDEGLNERGRYCVLSDAPPSAIGLYAVRSRICVDPVSALPLEVTDWDAKGLLERFVFHDLEPHAADGPSVFTNAAAGL